MKRVGQVMAELGFKKDAPDSVKEAFVKHLIRASEGTTVITPSERRLVSENKDRVHPLESRRTRALPEQLSFDFDLTGTDVPKMKTSS